MSLLVLCASEVDRGQRVPFHEGPGGYERAARHSVSQATKVGSSPCPFIAEAVDQYLLDVLQGVSEAQHIAFGEVIRFAFLDLQASIEPTHGAGGDQEI